MKREYLTEDESSKFNCEFTCYMISLQDYKNMVRLNTERLEQGERFEEINDRIYYAKFTQRMLILRDLVERRARVLKNSPQVRKVLLKYLEDPDRMDDELVYTQFKTVLLPSCSASANTASISGPTSKQTKTTRQPCGCSPKYSSPALPDTSSISFALKSSSHCSGGKKVSMCGRYTARLTSVIISILWKPW